MIHYPHDTPPDAGEAIELAPGVLWMRLPLPMKLDHVNLYALDDGDSWTLIDAGMKWAKATPQFAALRAGPLAGKPISRLVITHHHPDHVGYLGDLARDGCEVLATRTAWLTARMLTLDEQPEYTPEAIRFYERAGMAPEVLDKRRGERPFNFSDMVAPIPTGFTRLQEGEVIQMGGRTWDIRTGNGHAPEHATFWSREDDLVLSGDQILPSISPNIGVYPTEPDANPLGDWMESCHRFAAMAEDRHFVLGGHKLPFVGLPTRMRQLIENHEGALARLRKALTSPLSAGEVFTPIFKREIGGGEYGLALVEAYAHCLFLWHAGEVTRALGDDGAFRFQMISPSS